MVNIKTLLPELKALVTDLAEDLLARSQADDKIDAGLRDAFNQIEKGGPHGPGVRGLAGRLPRSSRRGLGAGLRLRPLHGGQPPYR